MDTREQYKSVIVGHLQNPIFRKELPRSTHTHCEHAHHPSCGDSVDLFLQVNPENGNLSAFFEGHGCAISMASSHMLCSEVQDITAARAYELLQEAKRVYTGTSPAKAVEDFDYDFEALAGVSQFPLRVKCAALSWKALESFLQKQFPTASKCDLDPLHDTRKEV